MPNVAQEERRALTDLFMVVGPSAPTLCTGWRTSDLAAHLVLRERRLDALPGILIPALSTHTDRVQQSIRDRRTWPALVDTVRRGPPFPLRFAAVDQQINTAEYYVHHEDVRRARSAWEPRLLDPQLEARLWKLTTTLGKRIVRDAPGGVTIEAPGHEPAVLKSGDPMVTVAGPPQELVLFVFGRGAVARVELHGEDDATSRLREAKFGL